MSGQLGLPRGVGAFVASGTIADWKNFAALGYLAVSAAPASYLPPLILMLMIGIAALQFLYEQSLTNGAPYVAALGALLGYMLIDGMVSGVPLTELLSYSALRYDANIFYSTLPLFLLGSGEVDLRAIDRWVGLTAIFGTMGYIVFPVVGIQLFDSHNAAGGFYMVLLAYLVGRALVDGLDGRRLSIAAAVLSLLLSDSRGSIVAVAIAVGLRLARVRFPRITLLGIGVAVVALLFGLMLCYQVWVDNGSIFLYDYNEFSSATQGLTLDQITLGERPGTILHRLFFLYPMAIDMFLQSPVFGVGFTRFDDFPVQIDGHSGLLAFNHGAIQHTNLHAHNSYLHIAAETGVVGLVLLFVFLRSIFRTFRGRNELFAPLEVVLGSLMLASMTEHRLTTPSQAAPAFILVGLFWACLRNGPADHSRPTAAGVAAKLESVR